MGALIVALTTVFLCLFFVYPVGAMMARGFDDGASGLVDVLTKKRTWKIVAQTIYMALAGTVGSVLLGIPSAYVFYRLNFPGQRIFRAIVSIPFVLPTVVVGVAFRALFAHDGPYAFLGLDQSVLAVVMAMIFFNYSLVVRTVGNVWASLDPRQVQAARTLGASPARVFCTVTVPALVPSIAGAASLVFLFCSTAYGIVQILGRPGYGTIETEIWVQTVTYLDLPAAAGLSIIQLFVVVLALAVQLFFTRRAERALSLRSPSLVVPSRSDAPAILISFSTLFFLVVMPLYALFSRALTHEGKWGLHNFRALATAGSGRAGGVTPYEALGNSLQIGLFATVIALVVGVPLSVVLARAAERLRWLDWLVMAPLGVSAVTVGFGFLVALQSPPLNLRSLGLLVPVAQAVIAVPMVVRAVVPTLRAINPRQREAAATLGAGPWRVLVSVDGPFIVRGVALAAGFAFAVSLGEFGATSFLASPSQPTLPVLISRLLSRPGADTYGMAMAGSLILALVTGGAMVVAEFLHSKSGAVSSGFGVDVRVPEGLSACLSGRVSVGAPARLSEKGENYA
ncbi:MAG: iron ABC transporter permease [Actinomycetaceae bacterium]|nr:iron ABC transporter permease [Actinomycetaceae bacterium]